MEDGLLKEYLHYYIDTMKPVSTGYQIEVYRKRGYIEYGHECNNFITFGVWKKVNKL